MSGRHKWSDIRRQGSPEEEAEIANEVRAMLRENALAQLRRKSEISQQELAAALGVSQMNISRIEHSLDSQISTVRRFIEGIGGELIVQAKIDGETFDLLTPAKNTTDAHEHNQ
jgi:DNA-binding XRE family transcriptional regulator